MTLQNRVDPRGEIVATPERGTLMGNRGCLCDEAGRLARRRWRLKAWIACRLEYRGWWRPVMRPGVWTELFFLDEATALAAGHRPCALCRRADYDRWRVAWRAGHGLDRPPRAVEMDAAMHHDRVRRDGSQVTYPARLADLPDGTMVALGTDDAWLWWQARLHPWSFAGYGPPRDADGGEVAVLTPAATVACLAAGYRPGVHETVADGAGAV